MFDTTQPEFTREVRELTAAPLFDRIRLARQVFGPVRKLIAVAVIGLASLGIVAQPAAAKGDDRGAAVKALKRQYGYLNDGQFDRLYGELHPSQQAIITQRCFIDSEQKSLTGASIEIQDVKKVYRTSTEIPGTGERARAYAITVKLKATRGGHSETGTTTSAERKVRGHWKFVVKQDVVDECAAS
jgi:hypothetical protein